VNYSKILHPFSSKIKRFLAAEFCFLVGLGFELKGFVLKKQILYFWSHTSSPKRDSLRKNIIQTMWLLNVKNKIC
jgi:hypothetical protein